MCRMMLQVHSAKQTQNKMAETCQKGQPAKKTQHERGETSPKGHPALQFEHKRGLGGSTQGPPTPRQDPRKVLNFYHFRRYLIRLA